MSQNIPIPENSVKVIQSFVKQKERIKAEVTFYASGLKEGLGLSSDWQLNPQNMSIFSPEDLSEKRPLPTDAIIFLQEMHNKLEEIETNLLSYQTGLLHGLGLPSGSTIDLDKKVIVSEIDT